MELKVLTPTTIQVKYVSFEIPILKEDLRFDVDDSQFLNITFDTEVFSYDDDTMQASIKGMVDIDEGKILTWVPTNHEITIFAKVCDEGIYTLHDENFKEVKKYEGYVPSIFECNEIGYGDYFNMTIDKEGYIKNWNKNIENKLEDLINKEF